MDRILSIGVVALGCVLLVAPGSMMIWASNAEHRERHRQLRATDGTSLWEARDIDAVGIDAETASLGIWRNAARGKWDRLFTGANAESAAMVLDPRPPPSLWRVLSCRTMFRPDRVTFHVTDGTLKLRNLGGNDLSLALTTDEFSVLAERRQFEGAC